MKVSATRQKIIETATSLFYKNGYNLTGINEIIAEAGIAKATLYSHFKSKEDICIAYLKYKNDTFIIEIEKFCTTQKKGKAQLVAIFDFLLNFFQSNDFNGCWCIRTVAEIPSDNEYIRGEIQGQKKDFLKFIEKLTQDNFPEKSQDSVENLSKQIYLLYESAVAESHLHQDNWPIQTTKELLIQLI